MFCAICPRQQSNACWLLSRSAGWIELFSSRMAVIPLSVKGCLTTRGDIFVGWISRYKNVCAKDFRAVKSVSSGQQAFHLLPFFSSILCPSLNPLAKLILHLEGLAQTAHRTVFRLTNAALLIHYPDIFRQLVIAPVPDPSPGEEDISPDRAAGPPPERFSRY